MSSSVAQTRCRCTEPKECSAKYPQYAITYCAYECHQCVYLCTGVSIPVDGGGLLTSWFNLDLQPRIAENGEDVVFGPDHTSSNGASNGNGTGKEDYPVVDSGARSVTAAATAPVQAVQMP